MTIAETAGPKKTDYFHSGKFMYLIHLFLDSYNCSVVLDFLLMQRGFLQPVREDASLLHLLSSGTTLGAVCWLFHDVSYMRPLI